MSKDLEAYKALATLEMSAMADDKMTVEKAEELRETIEKELKAFYLIKEKRVDVSLITDTKSLQEYNEKVPQYVISEENGVDRLLTQEEYDLLKEVL